MTQNSMLVLLVEDDHKHFLETRDLIEDIDDTSYSLVWKEDFESGLLALREGKFSACLLDLHIGEHSGLDFLKAAQKWGNTVPIILFTKEVNRETEKEAIEAGAADFLVKTDTNHDSLRRSLRFAMERTRAIAAVRDRDKVFRAIFDYARDAMIVADKDGHIVDANRAATELTGRSLDKLVGITADQFSPVHMDPELVKAAWKEFMDKGFGEGEFEVLRPDGSIRTAEYSATTNVLPGLQLSVLRDISEQKRLRTRVAILDRMASAGTLAAGLAHEINNPLAALMGYLEMAADNAGALPAGSRKTELADQLKQAAEAATRISLTVKDLKRFSLPEGERNSAVDLQAVMESSLRMAWNEIRHRATVVKNYEQLSPIKANESRIGQVFLNLLMNAAQSIEPGKSQDNKIVISVFKDGEGVAASVRDTGSGMAAPELSKIFDAFYSSKSEIGGTGLGLAICKGIVEEMGGKITVESSPGKGSCFTVHLPNFAADLAPEQAAGPPAPQSKKKVMIIDDEPTILSVFQSALANENNVSVLKSTHEALTRISAGEKFDAIICDMMMPEMTGMEFFKKLAELNPAQAKKVIFVSGGAFTFAEHEFMESNANGCLSKPFSREHLRMKVREVAGA